MTSIFRERAARKQYPNWAKTKYIISSYPPKNVIYKRYCFVNTKVISTVSDVYNPSRLHTLNSFKFWLLFFLAIRWLITAYTYCWHIYSHLFMITLPTVLWCGYCYPHFTDVKSGSIAHYSGTILKYRV